jgi:hypothetical protein
MYSMNRTSAGTPRPYSMRSTNSSSLIPFSATVSILVFVNPAGATDAIPARTAGCVPRCDSDFDRSARSVSRLTVTRPSPASLSLSTWSASSTPFVVIARSRRPGLSASIPTSVGRSWRSSGSPPVIRILSTPSDMNTSTSVEISSNVSRSLRGSHTYSASGMQ